jgi:hypothetical protein
VYPIQPEEVGRPEEGSNHAGIYQQAKVSISKEENREGGVREALRLPQDSVGVFEHY